MIRKILVSLIVAIQPALIAYIGGFNFNERNADVGTIYIICLAFFLVAYAAMTAES